MRRSLFILYLAGIFSISEGFCQIQKKDLLQEIRSKNSRISFEYDETGRLTVLKYYDTKIAGSEAPNRVCKYIYDDKNAQIICCITTDTIIYHLNAEGRVEKITSRKFEPSHDSTANRRYSDTRYIMYNRDGIVTSVRQSPQDPAAFHWNIERGNILFRPREVVPEVPFAKGAVYKHCYSKKTNPWATDPKVMLLYDILNIGYFYSCNETQLLSQQYPESMEISYDLGIKDKEPASLNLIVKYSYEFDAEGRMISCNQIWNEEWSSLMQIEADDFEYRFTYITKKH